MPAPNTAFTATPASTTVRRDTPARDDTASISPDATSAPRNAATGRGTATRTPADASAATRRTAIPAPELTPMTLGLASGLSSTA